MKLSKTVQRARRRKRREILSGPITPEELSTFRQRIHVVRFGHGLCWVYMSRSKGGIGALDIYGQKIPGHYGMMRFRGYQIGSHRFALALKEGCSLWELNQYQAGHLPYEVCMGA